MPLIYLTNGLAEDPFLFVERPGVREGFLMDCGIRVRGNLRRIRKLAGVFVTHAHIDHLIGFDHLVRALLGESLRLRVFGPEGIIEKVAGRLGSYDWDKSAEQSLTVDVTEIGPERFRRAELSCRRRFALGSLPDEPVRDWLFQAEEYGVRWAALDHGGSVCLGYACVEEGRRKIDPEALARLGMPPGPWVGRFLAALQATPESEAPFETPAGPVPLRQLAAEVSWVQPGQHIAYVTDTVLTPETLEAARQLASGADVLVCEATFLEEDREAARAYHHLTARDAAAIARAAGVRLLLLNHPSRRYHGNYERLLAEAREVFPRTQFVQYRRRGIRVG